MVSDTLADAVNEIRHYVEQFPDIYADDKELAELIVAMEKVQLRLDTPDRFPNEG